MKNRKCRGLENVVGAVLLLAIVGILIPIVYMYLSSMVTGSVAESVRFSAIRSFKIIAINYTSTTRILTVYILNTGRVPVKIVEIDVLQIVSPGVTILRCEEANLNLDIQAQSSAAIPVSNCTLSKGSYKVVAYSWSGFMATYTFYYSG